jgi:DNA-binding NarL/FixJ family response regulator
MTKKLMIVDDHAIARHLVRQVAATPQDTVLECVSPEEALKAVGIFKPDCVMMGVSRPTPNAFQAIKSIRAAHPQVRVVAVSSFPEADLRRMATEAGASGFVSTENLSELFLLAAPERLTPKPERRSPSRRRKNNLKASSSWQ